MNINFTKDILSNINFEREASMDIKIKDGYRASQLVFKYRSDFPEIGKENTLYIAIDEGSMYIYDSSLNTYNKLNADKTYVHRQIVPSDTWIIKHDLNKFCSVMITDSAESVVLGDINYIDENTVSITFSSAFSGKAYLN